MEHENQSSTLTVKFRSEYGIWYGMNERCYREDHPSYPYYGAVGILVCERWEDFSSFLEDMGPRPSSEYSIERKDSNGNYEPSNCEWIKKKDQSKNTTRSVRISSGSDKELLMDIPRHPTVSRELAYERVKLGWTVENATKKPVRAYLRRKKLKSYQEPLACPACEARRLKQIEAQKRYREKKNGLSKS